MKKDKTRFIYMDLLRGWALIIMIEVHIFNAFLNPALKESGWFLILNFINGLVAPAFLFVSGFAFVISSERRIDDLRKFGKYFWNKLSRIGLIFLAGYSLHLPFFSFSKIINQSSHSHLTTWFNVDILQCIAAGLLLLLILRILIKKEIVFYVVLLFLAIFISLISPVFWKINFGNILPLFFANYLTPKQGSYFPLFPWLFYLLAGAVYSKFFINSRSDGREVVFIKKLALYSIIPVVLGHLFLSGLFNSPLFTIRPNTLFIYQRLGYVLLLASLFWYFADKRQTKKSFVLDISRESLLIYWLHLEIIYSKVWNGKSLEEIIGQGLTVIECLGATFLLIVLMIIVAKLWGLFKLKHPVYASTITSAVIILTVIIFVIR